MGLVLAARGRIEKGSPLPVHLQCVCWAGHQHQQVVISISIPIAAAMLMLMLNVQTSSAHQLLGYQQMLRTSSWCVTVASMKKKHETNTQFTQGR